MNRKWIFETLSLISEFEAVMQGESLITANVKKPFAVYRMGNDTNEGLWEDNADNPQAGRQFFQVYLHDKPADYSRIDLLKDEVIRVLTTTPPPPGVLQVRYLETSRDLDDGALKTIYRYVRFQLVRAG